MLRCSLQKLQEERPSSTGGSAQADSRLALAVELCRSVDLDTYQLLDRVSPPLSLLTKLVEYLWRQALDFELSEDGMSPDFFSYPSRHAFCESLKVHPEGHGKAMVLENKEYQSTVFRRMHVELGASDAGFEVLHLVMFPRVRYSLPIFCLDLVAFGGRVSFAIVDCSPTSTDRRLPDAYSRAIAELRDIYLPEAEIQTLPEWANEVLSDRCVCIRPETDAQLEGFLGYCAALCNFHLECARGSDLISDDDEISEVYASHRAFAEGQLRNLKTSRLLEASFGARFTSDYMKQTMFDLEPTLSEPPSRPPRSNDFAVVNGRQYQVNSGPLAAVEVERGVRAYVPKGLWNPGEEIAMLRLLHKGAVT